MEIKICTYDKSDTLCDVWATKCVSLLDPKYRDLYKSTDIRFYQFFDDIDATPVGYTSNHIPKKEQIREVLDFTSNLTDNDRLLVHCMMGISRSTAMLIGILCQHGSTPDEAVNAVYTVRDQMWPNKLIIKYCDELLNLNGELILAVHKFKLAYNESLPDSSVSPVLSREAVDDMKRVMNLIK